MLETRRQFFRKTPVKTLLPVAAPGLLLATIKVWLLPLKYPASKSKNIIMAVFIKDMLVSFGFNGYR